jgi:TonB family protein
MSFEMEAIRKRTRKTTLVSGGIHILLILFLSLYQEIAPGPEFLTEITFIEPEPEVAAAPAAPAVPDWVRVTTLAKPQPVREHFKRELKRAEVAPQPQNALAVQDRLQERLAALQRDANAQPVEMPALVPRTTPSLAATSPVQDPGATPVELRRGTESTAEPIELKRDSRPTTAPVAAVLPEVRAETAPARKTDVVAQRTLAGATLVGPVADRRLLYYETPRYPEWAKRDAVEASVKLYFVVLSGGQVKENVMVQKTSGYSDFDGNATAALLTWEFEPLPASGEQWGEITFHYKLNGGNEE